MIDAKVAPAKPVAKPTPAVATPGKAEIVKIQAPGPMDRNAIIDRVAKALTDTRTVSGRFTQVDPQNASSSGAFYISRPGKVRFEYTSPEPIFIVSDGTTVSIEEPKRKAYDAIPLASTPLQSLPAFEHRSQEGRQRHRRPHGERLALRDAGRQDRRSGRQDGAAIPRSLTSNCSAGARSTARAPKRSVQLADMKKNVALKPSLFVVKDPSDVDDDRR